MRLITWKPHGRICWRFWPSVFAVIVLTALAAGSETLPLAQLSLQLRRGETEVSPPVEAPAEEGFARYDRSLGSFGIVSGSFDKPVDVAVDADENLFVLDQGNNRVERFDGDTQFQEEFGERGSKEGQFLNPGAIAVDGLGFIYVVDTGNHRVQKFSSAGEFLLQWGSLGSSSAVFNSRDNSWDVRFNRPRDIAFDADNNAYVADPENDRIQKFTANGMFLEEWNRFTQRTRAEIPFGSLVSLAYDSDRFGFLLALDATNNAVVRFELDGDYVETLKLSPPGECEPVRMETDNRDDYIFVADVKGNRILRFGKDGSYQGDLKGDTEKFSKPMGIFADREHKRFYVADTGNNRIHKFYWR